MHSTGHRVLQSGSVKWRGRGRGGGAGHLQSLGVGNAPPGVAHDVGVLGDAVVDALDGVRYPSIACRIHELAGDDADGLVHPRHPQGIVAHSPHHTYTHSSAT